MKNNWINATELYNWTNGDQVLDWLVLYGHAKGYEKDKEDPNYIEEGDLGLFTREKGKRFEAGVLKLLKESVDVAIIEGAASNHDDFYEQTLRLIDEGCEAIYQGLVRDHEQKVFGVPDLIVRGDVLERIVPGTLDGPADSYYIVDVKYKSLGLNKWGDVSSKHNWEKVQLTIYEGALAKMLGRARQRSYILGRSAGGESVSCLDALGWVKPDDPKTLIKVEEGLQWVRDLHAHGDDWTLDPPSDPRITLDPIKTHGGDWSNVVEELAGTVEPEDDDSPEVSPAHISANRAEWIKNRGVEFYVDYETLNSMNDDFTQLPKMNGRPMIFMIGCGHIENGDWKFKVWTAKEETYESEKKIIEDWLVHMDAVRQRLAPEIDRPHVYHWYRHEPVEIGKAADRHNRPEWRDVPWYDLLAKVMKAEPVMVRGAQGHSLKPITRNMKEMGLIETAWGETAWGESQVSGGTEAMTAAWWCYKEARESGVSVFEVAPDDLNTLMGQIESYNEVDCKAMWDILRYLRANH